MPVLREHNGSGWVDVLSAPANMMTTDTVQTATAVKTLPAVGISGLTGAVSGSRCVGATASIAPTTGTFLTGDWVVTLTGRQFVCTAGGTPGTWAETGKVALTAADVAPGTFPAGSYTMAGNLAIGSGTYTGWAFTANSPSATAATRYVGGTTSGAPVAGTWVVGDFVIGQDASFWVCTAAGTPGTWKRASVTAADVSAGTFPAGTWAFAANSKVQISGDGTANAPELSLFDTKAGQATPNKTLRSYGGALEFINSAYSAVIATLYDNGALALINSISVATNAASNMGSLELGQRGVSNTPYVDFHSGATDVDYDARIIATGGTGSTGGGTLNLQAASIQKNSREIPVTATGRPSINLTATASGTLVASPTFGLTFPGIPKVVAVQSSLPGGSSKILVKVNNISTTGFDLYFYTGDGTAMTATGVTVDWIAVYQV